MRKRQDAAGPVASRVKPPALLTVGKGSVLVDYLPPQDRHCTAPDCFWCIAQARKLRDLTRFEWCRITGVAPPSPVWARGCPFEVSVSLRKAGVELARSLAG